MTLTCVINRVIIIIIILITITAIHWYRQQFSRWHDASLKDINKLSGWLPIICGGLSDSAYCDHVPLQPSGKATRGWIDVPKRKSKIFTMLLFLNYKPYTMPELTWSCDLSYNTICKYSISHAVRNLQTDNLSSHTDEKLWHTHLHLCGRAAF